MYYNKYITEYKKIHDDTIPYYHVSYKICKIVNAYKLLISQVTHYD